MNGRNKKNPKYLQTWKGKETEKDKRVKRFLGKKEILFTKW